MQTNLLLNLIVNGINDGRAQGMNLEEHARLCWPWREKRNEKSVCERERNRRNRRRNNPIQTRVPG